MVAHTAANGGWHGLRRQLSILDRMLSALFLAFVVAVPAAADGLGLERVATGLSRPIFAGAPHGDTQRLFIAEQHTGRIRILDLNTESLLAEPFLDIDGLTTGNEQGLLGVAFHPQYEENGYFYVNFTDPTGGGSGTTKVVRYQVSADDPQRADPDSATLVLSYAQPFSNHNAGWMGFNPSILPGEPQYLYIASGDGGSGNDPQNHAQTLSSKLGKILRIDVDGDNRGSYGVPESNPFYESGDGDTSDDEVWAYGLRNPWRAGFDRQTGDFWIGDVGQATWEEIDFQPAASEGGENYGWRVREGTRDTGLGGGSPPFVDPIHQYDNNSDGVAVVGGHVYRGEAIAGLRETYFFGDYAGQFGSGGARIWSLRYEGGAVSDLVERTAELTPDVGSFSRLLSFGEDARGEIYVLDQGGDVFRITGPGHVVGDLNCDGQVDFDDIEALVLGLRDPAAYQAVYGLPASIKGDTDSDGDLDFDDIGPFVDLITVPAAAANFPEPATGWLLLVCGAVLYSSSARRRARTL